MIDDIAAVLGNRRADLLVEQLANLVDDFGVLASVAALAITAIYGVSTVGGVRHWSLFIHVLAGGCLSACAAVLAVCWFAAARPGNSASFRISTRFGYWLLLACAAVTAATAFAGMLPWLGTDALEQSLQLHRWSGLALILATMLHAQQMRVERRRPRPVADAAARVSVRGSQLRS